MQHPLLDLLRASLIPELCPDITAGPSRHIHLILIRIAAVRAFPDKFAMCIRNDLNLSVIIAYLTVVALDRKSVV